MNKDAETKWLEVEEPPTSLPVRTLRLLNSEENDRVVQEMITMFREIPEEDSIKALEALENMKIIRPRPGR